MGHHHEGQALAVQLIKEIENLCGGLGVERAGWFVGEQEAGVVDQRPCNRHPLLLPAGELIGPMVGAVAQPDPRQGGDGALPGRRPSDTSIEER